MSQILQIQSTFRPCIVNNSLQLGEVDVSKVYMNVMTKDYFGKNFFLIDQKGVVIRLIIIEGGLGYE